LPTAVTVVEAALEDLPQHQRLIQTARILLAGKIATEMAAGGMKKTMSQDVPHMVSSMEQN
jgi:uncharacterized protein YbcI